MKVSNNHQNVSFKALKLGKLTHYAKREFVEPCLPDLEALAKKADIKFKSVEIPTGIKEISEPGIMYEISERSNNLFKRLFKIPEKKYTEIMNVSNGSLPLNILALRVEQIMKEMKIIK